MSDQQVDEKKELNWVVAGDPAAERPSFSIAEYAKQMADNRISEYERQAMIEGDWPRSTESYLSDVIRRNVEEAVHLVRNRMSGLSAPQAYSSELVLTIRIPMADVLEPSRVARVQTGLQIRENWGLDEHYGYGMCTPSRFPVSGRSPIQEAIDETKTIDLSKLGAIYKKFDGIRGKI